MFQIRYQSDEYVQVVECSTSVLNAHTDQLLQKRCDV